MDGFRNKLRMVVMGVLAVCVIGAPGVFADDGKVVVSGVVTVDGEAPKKAVALEVVTEKGRVAAAEVKRDGRYSATISVPAGTRVVVRPYEDGMWGCGAKSLTVGQAVLAVSGATERVDVRLRSAAMVQRSMRVVTKDARPVVGVSIKCKVEMPALGQKDIPSQTYAWTALTGDGGDVLFEVPEEGAGSYVFTLDANGKGNDTARYSGKREVSFEAARGEKTSEAWVVECKALSMEVRFKWDETFSREPFLPDVDGAAFRHNVVVNGPSRQVVAMDREGVVRLYGLLPGEYTVELAKAGGEIYSIAKGPKAVAIGLGADASRVEILLLPVKRVQVSGKVVDASDGAPIGNAIVTGGSTATNSAADGRFTYEGVAGERSTVQVHHESYWPGEFEIGKGGDQGDLKLKPYPRVAGAVVQGEKAVPVPYAVLEFKSDARKVKVVADEHGKYATRIPPGRHGLIVTMRYKPEDAKPLPADAPKVCVYDAGIDVPPEGLKKDIAVGGVGALTVTIAGPTSSGKTDFRGIIVCLLRPSDKKVVMTRQIAAGKDTVDLVAQEGEYQLLVARNEQVGQLCGDVKIEAGATRKEAVVLGKWGPISIAQNGTVKTGKNE